MTPVEVIHAAATSLEGQAIGLKEQIATRKALGANRWPAWNIEWNEAQLVFLRNGYRALKWLAANPHEIPQGLAAYLDEGQDNGSH